MVRRAAHLSIDLAGVAAVDSAGLALLIDWLAAARSRWSSLQLPRDLPGGAQALADLSEVGALTA